jgi:hypothetical protein
MFYPTSDSKGRDRHHSAMGDSKPTNLFWVKSSTSDAPLDRPKHRREVMQKVALRQKQEHQQNHPNRRQLPVFYHNQGSGESSASREHDAKSVEAERVITGSSLQPNNSDSAPLDSDQSYPRTSLTQLMIASATHPTMLAQCNLDFLELSSLAALEVGRFTGQRVLEKPRSIAHFLGGKNWSYCRYVPFYYAESTLIRNATDCVVAQVRCLLSPEDLTWESLALTSYSNALSNLQDAINSAPQPPSAEVLCATQILSLYEVSF